MNHAEAAEIVRRAWRRVHGREPSAAERSYAQAIAFLETGYGRAGQHGKLAAAGLYNWGNVELARAPDGPCPQGYAPGVDVGPVCFRVSTSDEEAAAVFLRALTRRHWPVLEAMKGDAWDVAKAMRAPPAYYAGSGATEAERVAGYASAIRGALRAMGEREGARPWQVAGALAVVGVAAGLVVGVLRLRG